MMPVDVGKDPRPVDISTGQRFSPVQVHCYAGYRADETPRALRLPGQPRLEILDIHNRWTEPRYRCFRVTVSDGRNGLLRQDVQTFRWAVCFR